MKHAISGSLAETVRSVEKYDIASGVLTLGHHYPSSSATTLAQVDIDLVMETSSRLDLEVGAWINVIGYLTATPPQMTSTLRRAATEVRTQARRKGERSADPRTVSVQAVMLWSAGAIKLDEYERSLELRKQANG